jgi:Activator of Hsp90 ATPase homolog 1-like protein
MNKKSYAKTIRVSANTQEAFDALTRGYKKWWTSVDNNFDKVGDQIKFTFPPMESYWTFEAKILEPNKVVELECVDALHLLIDKPQASKTEWLGTKARWTIEPQADHTDIHFVHDGLTPDLHCYEVCEAGWDLFFVDSLKAYLDTGTGKPYQAG